MFVMTGLICMLFAANVGARCCTKISSDIVAGNPKMGYNIFLTVNFATACLFFLILCKFSPVLSLRNLYYAVLYSGVVFVSLISSMNAYRIMDIAKVGVITSSGTLVATLLIGKFVFGEDGSVRDVIRLLLMLVAVFFVFTENSKSAEKGNTDLWKKVLILAVIICNSCAAIVVQKFYVADKSADNNSFFLLTNVVSLAIIWVWMGIQKICHSAEFTGGIKKVTFMQVVVFVLNVVCSNIGSIVGLILITKLTVAMNTVVTTAVGMLSGAAASVIYREKIGFCVVIALVLSFISLIV